MRAKLTSQVQEMVTSSEFTANISHFNSDITQKLLDLRSEVLTRVADLNTQTMDVVAMKANQDDFRVLIDEKVDMSVMKTYLNQKLGLGEFDALKVTVERLHADMAQKSSCRDIDGINEFIKNQFDHFSKELLLRVQIKDLCTLLDQKANLNDVNKTLEIVQSEVETCVKDEKYKEALNDQALVNEALCAENCVGRWVWKSGDLHSQNMVPLEV